MVLDLGVVKIEAEIVTESWQELGERLSHPSTIAICHVCHGYHGNKVIVTLISLDRAARLSIPLHGALQGLSGFSFCVLLCSVPSFPFNSIPFSLGLLPGSSGKKREMFNSLCDWDGFMEEFKVLTYVYSQNKEGRY